MSPSGNLSGYRFIIGSDDLGWNEKTFYAVSQRDAEIYAKTWAADQHPKWEVIPLEEQL